MKLVGLELRRVELPLVAPFRTSFGTETVRDILLVRAVTADGEGWGECVAGGSPLYSSEYVDGAADVIRPFLAPRLLAAPRLDPHAVARLLSPVKGHRMAKAALEMAVTAAHLRQRGDSLASYLGGVWDRVPAGVSVGTVGIMQDVPRLLDTVADYLAQGYVRIKLKIEPGWDIAPVRAVRERFGDTLAPQVDANAAYTLADAGTPGDTSASDRYWANDLTEPFTLDEGYLTVPTGPGLGVAPVPEVLAEATTATEWIPAG